MRSRSWRGGRWGGVPLADLRSRATSPESQLRFKRWFDAAPIYSGPPAANRLGWQVARTTAKRAAISARRRRFRLDAAAARALDRDGIVVIQDHLAPADHALVRAACAERREAGLLRDIGGENGSGITFLSGPVVNAEPDDPGAVIQGLLGRDLGTGALAAHVIGRNVGLPLRLVHQYLSLDAGGNDDQDREQVLHADKAYPCIKAIYAVDAITEDTSPFIYCPGTHRLSLERLRYEHAMGISESLRRRRARDREPDGIELERGRSVMGASFRERLGVVERAMTCTSNTLIITNNAGFHRRGQLVPGTHRETLWVNFYPHQRPVYGKLAFRLAKTAVDTDAVSRELSAQDRQDGGLGSAA